MMHTNKGFTLIEVMVVVAIVTILASIAYPSYVSHVERSNRSEGISALVTMSGDLERYFTVNSEYTTFITAADDANGDGNLGFADNLSETGLYALSITSNNDLSIYTITAAPVGGDALCGSFTLTNTGVRAVTGDADDDGNTNPDDDDLDICWR